VVVKKTQKISKLQQRRQRLLEEAAIIALKIRIQPFNFSQKTNNKTIMISF
jgi:hypothetical protein